MYSASNDAKQSDQALEYIGKFAFIFETDSGCETGDRIDSDDE
jgi:hypothetical protein